MINYPLISIALATYNGEKFISHQLDSLFIQDYPNLEIIISDDCSTDRTWEMLEGFARSDQRVRLLPRDKRRGYVGNFLRVFQECKGEWISPCDQDDIWYPHKTRRLLEEAGDADLIYCNNRYIDSQGKSLGIFYTDRHRIFSGKDARQLLFATSVCGHACIFKKKILCHFDIIKNAPYIDWAVAFMAANNNGVKFLDEALVDWRQHSTSFTAFAHNDAPKKGKRLIEDEMANLDFFLLLPSPYGDFIKKARDLHFKWATSYFYPKMLFFVLRHGGITHSLHNSRFPSLKYILGFKSKKILRPRYYE